jgi:L-amino acid N-acyltransferase YncA
MRSGEVIVRASEPRDIEAITSIYRDAVLFGTASFELTAPDPLEMAQRCDALLAGGYPYLTAERDREVVGYAYAAAYRTRPAYRSTVENSVYVRQDAQKGGIGRLLLKQLIEEATRRGFRQMVAIIGDSGNDGSIRLHEAAGFALVGVLRSVGWKHGRWLDTVVMQRALGVGDAEARDAT